MINVTFDNTMFSKKMKNVVLYSDGFFEGAENNLTIFNENLGNFIKKALGEYIDSKARMNPEQLHHVYEWNKVGVKTARLFDFDVFVNRSLITISGRFINSSSNPPGGNDPFINKAYIMENKIAVTIAPKNASVLVFEDDEETVFTTNSVYIANPGGDEVAGSFGVCFEEFFDNYLTSGLLMSAGIFDKLSNPQEYVRYFAQGAKSGKFVGINAGKKYMNIPTGLDIQ